LSSPVPSGVTAGTKKVWDRFAAELSPHDDLVISVRHRFFLEKIEELKPQFLVNLASGFTSYPFILPPSIKVIEVDRPHILEHKQKMIGEWNKNRALPERDVIYLAADLSSADESKNVFQKIRHTVGSDSTFVLMEGLSYFMSATQWQTLIQLISDFQQKGSYLGFDFWKPELDHSRIFSRFRNFFF